MIQLTSTKSTAAITVCSVLLKKILHLQAHMNLVTTLVVLTEQWRHGRDGQGIIPLCVPGVIQVPVGILPDEDPGSKMLPHICCILLPHIQ